MRIVVAEDLTLLRDGLIRMLEAYDFEVVTAVDNGPGLLEALLTL
jgi:DNA-binding NarL/FixJ family response regulator